MRDIGGERSRDLGWGSLGAVRNAVSTEAQKESADDYLQRKLFEGGIVSNSVRWASGTQISVVGSPEVETVRQCAGNHRPKVTSS
jgi:hypothetical protein